MTILYFEALAAIAVSLSVLMAGAWLAQQRTGNGVGWNGDERQNLFDHFGGLAHGRAA